MTKAAELRRRVDALTTAFKGTLAGRLMALTDDDRAAYQRWRTDLDGWHREHPDGSAYAQLVNGEPGPRLPRSLATLLFGEPPPIPLGSTGREAADVYRRFALED